MYSIDIPPLRSNPFPKLALSFSGPHLDGSVSFRVSWVANLSGKKPEISFLYKSGSTKYPRPQNLTNGHPCSKNGTLRLPIPSSYRYGPRGHPLSQHKKKLHHELLFALRRDYRPCNTSNQVEPDIISNSPECGT